MKLSHDNLDDRREIHTLLHYLPPADRIRFLVWVCKRSQELHPGRGIGYIIDRPLLDEAYRSDRGNDRLTTSLYTELLSVVCQWGVPIAEIAVRLVDAVRRRGFLREALPIGNRGVIVCPITGQAIVINPVRSNEVNTEGR